jgi:predicted transcriptional regulator
MKKSNKWTVRQHGLLKRYYGEVTMEELSKKLGKSKSAIYSKVHYLRERGWAFK